MSDIDWLLGYDNSSTANLQSSENHINILLNIICLKDCSVILFKVGNIMEIIIDKLPAISTITQQQLGIQLLVSLVCGKFCFGIMISHNSSSAAKRN